MSGKLIVIEGSAIRCAAWHSSVHVIEKRPEKKIAIPRFWRLLLLKVVMLVGYSVRTVQAGMPMTVNVRRDPRRR